MDLNCTAGDCAVPAPDNPKFHRVWLRFGAGLSTRQPETQIDPSECADGVNFDLDIENTMFTGRKPYDLVAKAPNNGPINGWAQLVKADGTISTLIQAGNTVYSWDGTYAGFTQVGTVVAGTKLRGPRTANWLLDDLVIITDLAKLQPVMTWDGTTFSVMVHNLSGSFYAAYCHVDKERAFYGNVRTSTDTPHLLVASKRSDYKTLSTTVRPASGVALDDPWFLLMPDFRPINGMLSAFGRFIISTRESNIYALNGNDATDYALGDFFVGSGASGDESLAYVGNDVVYGRRGKVERLSTIVNLGDVEVDDLSREIANLVRDVNEWTIVFDPRTLRTFCFGEGRGDALVYHQSFGLDRPSGTRREGSTERRLSGWSRWTTNHELAFQPQMAWNMLRQTDGIAFTYMGGPNGSIYQLDGTTGRDGLSFSPQAANLLSFPEAFDDSYWGKLNLSVTPNVTVAPNMGAQVIADKFVEDTTNGRHSVFKTDAVAAGDVVAQGTYTLSVYARAGERTAFEMLNDAAANNFVSAEFDLSAGTASTPTLGGGGGVASATSSIEVVDSNWYRCVLTFTLAASYSAGLSPEFRLISGGTTSYLGDGASGMSFWRAYLNTGASPPELDRNVEAFRTSGVFVVPSDADMSDFKGYIHYRKKFASTVTLSFLWGGERLMDTEKTISLEAATGIPVYGGGFYYNNDTYYGTQFNARLTRQVFSPDGQGSQFQVKVEDDGAGEFAIESIMLEFRAKK